MMTMVKLMMMMMMMIGTGLAFRFLQWPVLHFKSVICPPLCEPQIGQDSVLSLTILNALQRSTLKMQNSQKCKNQVLFAPNDDVNPKLGKTVCSVTAHSSQCFALKRYRTVKRVDLE